MNRNTIELKISTLTPVHIGSGRELFGNYDYLSFLKEGQLGVIDEGKILALLGTEYIDSWVAAIDQGQDILEVLPQLRAATITDIAQRVINIEGTAPDSSRNRVKEQIHLGDQQPTIPGSSLKGAIRTALLSKLIKDNPDFVQKDIHLGKTRHGKIRSYSAQQIEAYYTSLGRPDTNRFEEFRTNPNKDVFRMLRVRDAYFKEPTCVVRNKVINLFWNGQWGEKREESSFYECIPAGAETGFSIQIPGHLLENVQRIQRLRHPLFDLIRPARLFKEINKHYLELLTNEINFWEDEENPLAIGDYLDHLQNIKSTAEELKDDACILRVGAASGWDFMTGGWAMGRDRMGDYILSDDSWTALKNAIRRKNYPDDIPFPKTRKMISSGMPFGFVIIKLASEDKAS